MEVSEMHSPATAIRSIGLRLADEAEPERGFVFDGWEPEWQDELNAYERAQVRALALTTADEALAPRTV